MSSIRIRPRFIIKVNFTPEELIDKIESRLKSEETDFYAESMLLNFIVLKIKETDRKIWTPQLALSIDKSENGCTIRGLYGPRPTLWFMFIFFYTGIGLGTMFSGLYGLARVSLNLEAPILWLIPVLLGLALFLYLIAQAGQKFSAQQMFEIHQFFEKAIERKIKIH